MTTEQIECPCCGQLTRGGQVMVSLEQNQLWFGEHTFRLQPLLCEMAFVLARRMPETVHFDTLVKAMWGDAEGRDARNGVKVAATKLRRQLRPVGLDIVNTWDVGYRMTRMLKTERHSHHHATEENHAQA